MVTATGVNIRPFVWRAPPVERSSVSSFSLSPFFLHTYVYSLIVFITCARMPKSFGHSKIAWKIFPITNIATRSFTERAGRALQISDTKRTRLTRSNPNGWHSTPRISLKIRRGPVIYYPACVFLFFFSFSLFLLIERTSSAARREDLCSPSVPRGSRNSSSTDVVLLPWSYPVSRRWTSPSALWGIS